MSTSLPKFHVMMEGCLMRYPYRSQLRLAERSPMVTVVVGGDNNISAVRKINVTDGS